MKYILAPFGTGGDVLPLMWIGQNLVARGHEVIALTHEPFDKAMESIGARVVSIGDARYFDEVIRDPRIWNPRHALKLLLEVTLSIVPEVIDAIGHEAEQGREGQQVILIGGALSFGARIAAEKWNLPLITIQLQPCSFISAEQMSVPGSGLEWMTRTPLWLRKLFVECASFFTDRYLVSRINGSRKAIGLKGRVKRIFLDYWFSPDCVLALFPDWFCTAAGDWPTQTQVTRFPLFDNLLEQASLDADIERFLSDGDPPVLFTAGTGNCHAADFFSEAVHACALLNRRAIFLTQYLEQIPDSLPESICARAYLPFSLVFPSCCAVVHHGGIGTLSQALNAGIPQLIMPLSFDQPDNAHRLQKMGVGDTLYPRHFKAEKIARKLQFLTQNKAVAEACIYYQKKMKKQISTDRFIDKIEGFFVKP